MSITVNTGDGTTEMSLRRGRPRYRGGYLWEVLQYISWQQRKNHWRPVHIANSIACRDMRMSKSSWLRVVRVAEAMLLLRRDPKAGGWHNKGSLYWLSDPPQNGRHPSPNGHGPANPGVPSLGSGPESATQNFIAGPALSYSKSRYRKSERTYRNGHDADSVNVPELGASGPNSRIAEGTLGVPSCPKGQEDGRGRDSGAGLTASGSVLPNAPGPTQTAADVNPPQSPSQRSGSPQPSRGVPVRFHDGTETVIPASGPPPEITAYMHELLTGVQLDARALRYLAAVANKEEGRKDG